MSININIIITVRLKEINILYVSISYIGYTYNRYNNSSQLRYNLHPVGRKEIGRNNIIQKTLPLMIHRVFNKIFTTERFYLQSQVKHNTQHLN